MLTKRVSDSVDQRAQFPERGVARSQLILARIFPASRVDGGNRRRERIAGGEMEENRVARRRRGCEGWELLDESANIARREITAREDDVAFFAHMQQLRSQTDLPRG